ncbi:hypothetical protein HA402_011675 [Bradysia odoriphaga]|nr:hypothetical protein HA402_011675 [Bradysia odoriphaga]
MDHKILFLLIVLSCCSVSFGSNDTDSPIVEVKQGKIVGKVLKSRNGRDFYSFLGIPYGQAERFQPPSLAVEWDGIFEAKSYGPQCAQKMWITNQNIGEENCLQLQVFTPSLSNNLPVAVYFHGGGFSIGTSNVLQPQYFMDENVVLVLVNYRLGPFGFLSMQDELIPGNNGLKDQNIALKWVQQNIANFGGNTDRVTLFGNSAGAASVSFHILSPQSAGLFHAAILQSGCALNPWAMSKHPREMASRFGTNIGCPTDTSAKFLSCLHLKTTEEILNSMEPLTQWNYDPFTPFGVVIEPDVPGAFLSVDPLKSLETGNYSRVPVIAGVVEDEGILLHSAYILEHPKLLQDLNEHWTNVLPISLQFDRVYTNFTDEQQLNISTEIRKFYFNNQTISEDNRQQLTNVYSDRLFNHGVRKCAVLLSEHSPVYSYQFAHNRGDYSILRWFNIDKIFGVSHVDELSFLFAESYALAPEFQKDSIAETVSKNFVKLWASFITNGYPTEFWGNQQKWEPISRDEREGKIPLKFYRMDADTSIIDEPFADRIEFWENILKENYQDGAQQ